MVVVVLALLGGILPALSALPGAVAVADECVQKVETSPGVWKYVNVCTEPGDDGAPAGTGGGTAEPSCELTGLASYCIGTSACWANVPSALDPATWPEETRPSPEAIYTYQSCDPDPDGTLTGWSWYTPDEISVTELARQALGSLATPEFTVGFNPPVQAIVGVDTWFWAQTAAAGTVTGTSALGVVAIGEPDRIEVDPGDGTGVRTCPWSTSASAACSHAYVRSSVGQPVGPDGEPSYTVRLRLVYQVRFENNGAPLTVDGLPSTLESPWRSVALPVAEIQSVVTSTGS